LNWLRSRLRVSGLLKKKSTSSFLTSLTSEYFHLGFLSLSIRRALTPSKNSVWLTNPYEILYSISNTSFKFMFFPLLICSKTTAILKGLRWAICFCSFLPNSEWLCFILPTISYIESSLNIWSISPSCGKWSPSAWISEWLSTISKISLSVEEVFTFEERSL